MKKINNEVLSILICLFLLSGCDSPNKEVTVAENVSYVKTAKATPIVMSIPIRATGKLATRTEMKLSFKTGGILEELNVKEGQQVSKGKLLATLDLSEINARVKQTSTSFEKAKRDYKRAQNLYQDSVVTLETVQNAKSAYDIAIAEKEIAEFNLRHSRITAPTDGKIQQVLLEVNEISAPGHPVILFATTENDWVVRLAVTDKDIVRCSINDSAKVMMDAFPNAIFHGAISKLGTFPDPVTGTYEVEILLDDQNAEFRTGFISQVTITPSDTVNAFILPLKAIIDIEGDYGYVFQTDSSKVEKQKVRLWGLQNNGIVILEGINENQQVVIDGAGFLKNGDRISVVN